MVQASLVDYFLRQIDAGINIDQVKKQLKQQGYDSREVDSSARYAYDQRYNPQLAKKQRIDQLVVYIRQQLSAGYQIPQIKQFLLSRGYAYDEIDSATERMTKPAKQEHTVLIAAVMIIGILGVTLTIVLLLNLKMFSFLEQDLGDRELLDVKAKKLTGTPTPGSTLDFQLDIFNLGADKRYDILLDYSLVDKETGDTLAGVKETFAVESSTSKILQIEIPSTTPPGKYIIEIDASYGEVSAKAGFIFNIYPKEQVEKIKTSLPEEEQDDTEKILEQIEQAVETQTKKPVEKLPELKKEQFEGMTTPQKMDAIKREAYKDPIQATAMCKTFQYSRNQKDCIINIVEVKQDVNFCGYIEDTIVKEGCYLEVFMKKPEMTDCSLIETEQTKKSCELMLQANLARAKYEAGEYKPEFEENPYGTNN